MRSDLSYARYSRATWDWWCHRHDADFVVIDTPVDDSGFAHMPPTLQRWVVVDRLIRERGPAAQIVLVDADTMIRWDTPDLFGQARGFSAVADSSPVDWIVQSRRAFQHLFPGVSLPWWEYFNSGVVVLGAAQRPVLRAFLDYATGNWPELNTAISEGRLGTDQTVINFIVRREKEPVFFLPRPYNFLHCFPMDGDLFQIEFSPLPDTALFAEKAFARPAAFNFVEHGYIWHFTNVVTLRALVMGETWRRVRHNYPGAICDEK